MITKGTDPAEAVKDLPLIFSRDEYKTNTRPVHWSGANYNEVPDGFVDALKGENKTLAIWSDGKRFVAAWVEA
jgi:hypothetical protein